MRQKYVMEQNHNSYYFDMSFRRIQMGTHIENMATAVIYSFERTKRKNMKKK